MNKKNSLVRLVHDSKSQWLGMVGFVFFSLLAGPLKIITAILWGNVIDLGVAGQMKQVFLTATLMLLFVLLDALRTAFHYKIIGNTTEKMFMRFRLRAFSLLSDADIPALEERVKSGDLAMRVSTDIEQLCDDIAGNFSLFARLIFQAIFAAVACVFLSWQLSSIYFIILPFSFWLFNKISKPIQTQRKIALDSTGKAMNLATDVLGGAATVKSFNLQEEMNSRFKDVLDDAYEQYVKTEKIGILMTVAKYLFNVIQIMFVFLFGTWLVNQGTITIGNVMAFIALSVYITEAFSMIEYAMRVMNNSTALACRLYEVLDLELEPEGMNDNLVFSGELIRMQGLSFSYDNGKTVLNNININLSKGQKVALIGHSGCGKSTIIKLICNFYLPQSGKITQFGIDAKHIRKDSLRKNLALVSQDSVLFNSSIYENVLFGRLDASEAEVLNAIKDANLYDFISSLPDGIHTRIGEFGADLSGGQRQRICIARAMLKNAQIVLLDEATSALDTQTEKEIQKAMDKLLLGRAAIIVAHRLSTVQNVDYLYCLENGNIIEEGIPSDLLNAKGYYYRMCIQQGLLDEEVMA